MCDKICLEFNQKLIDDGKLIEGQKHCICGYVKETERQRKEQREEYFDLFGYYPEDYQEEDTNDLDYLDDSDDDDWKTQCEIQKQEILVEEGRELYMRY